MLPGWKPAESVFTFLKDWMLVWNVLKMPSIRGHTTGVDWSESILCPVRRGRPGSASDKRLYYNTSGMLTTLKSTEINSFTIRWDKVAVSATIWLVKQGHIFWYGKPSCLVGFCEAARLVHEWIRQSLYNPHCGVSEPTCLINYQTLCDEQLISWSAAKFSSGCFWFDSFMNPSYLKYSVWRS